MLLLIHEFHMFFRYEFWENHGNETYQFFSSHDFQYQQKFIVLFSNKFNKVNIEIVTFRFIVITRLAVMSIPFRNTYIFLFFYLQ